MARNYRATILNILMLTGVLAMAGHSALFQIIGGLAAAVATGHFLYGAVRATNSRRHSANLYQLMLIWVPGLLAMVLSASGLVLTAMATSQDLLYFAGIALFGCEAAMLALAAADIERAASAGSRMGEVG